MSETNKKLTILDVTLDSNDSKYVFLNDYEYKTNWFEDLKFSLYSLFSDIRRFIRNIFIGIKNIIEYAPIIYQDRDWDYQYLLYLMKFKLKRIRKCIKDDNIIVDAQKVSEEIQIAIEKIDELEKSDELYEDASQLLLQQIKNTNDKDLKEELIKQYYIGLYKFEEEQWSSLWTYIYYNMQKWWD